MMNEDRLTWSKVKPEAFQCFSGLILMIKIVNELLAYLQEGSFNKVMVIELE